MRLGPRVIVTLGSGERCSAVSEALEGHASDFVIGRALPASLTMLAHARRTHTRTACPSYQIISPVSLQEGGSQPTTSATSCHLHYPSALGVRHGSEAVLFISGRQANEIA